MCVQYLSYLTRLLSVFYDDNYAIRHTPWFRIPSRFLPLISSVLPRGHHLYSETPVPFCFTYMNAPHLHVVSPVVLSSTPVPRNLRFTDINALPSHCVFCCPKLFATAL